jgi:hypothetical protein
MMKKILLTAFYGIALGLSSIAYGMGNDIQSNEVSRDACKALQETHSMVHADLEKAMQTSFQAPLPTQQSSIFGVDDTESYAGRKATVLGHLHIEG